MFGEGVMYSLLFISLYFEVFLLVAFLQKRFTRIQTAPLLESELPRTAIVVPCFNEETTVPSTVQSLLALDYPEELLSIIIVDDGSSDNTLSIIRAFPADSRIKIFHKENGGKHSAMNLALAHTDAELIGCLDADSIVAPDALRKIVPIFRNAQIAAVTPGIHVRNPQSILQHMQNVEYNLSVFNRWIFAALGSVFITPGPFSIFRTSILRELGGWREGHSTEDMELALRLQVAGHLIANAPRAVVHTSTPSTFRNLFRQRVRWTYGWLRNVNDYRFILGRAKYGNLGMIVLPAAMLLIFIGIYFFARLVFMTGSNIIHTIERYYYGGFHFGMPSFDIFFFNTNALLLISWISVALILTLICMGSFIGTGRRLPPASTPLFLLFFSVLVPLWLSAAVVRAVFKTGVRWR